MDCDSGAQRLTGERRLVTTLFCDVVGSTPLAGQLDPEELHGVLAEYQAQVGKAISGKRGHVALLLGDGVLGYFGWPYPDESHAESAVRAAFAILDALGPKGLPVRIGIATGLVVTSGRSGAGPEQAVSAVGQAPNLAARLQDLAAPGTIIVSEGTRNLLGDVFPLLDLGEIGLKGFEDPQRAWRVTCPASVSSRSETLYAGRLPKLIGREDELAVLLRCWERAAAGAGQALLVSGEAGIGKSRLLAEFDRHISAQPRHIFRYFCSQHAGDSPLSPIIARWERDAAFAPDDSAETRLRKLEAAVAGEGLSRPEFAGLATLLSLPAACEGSPLDASPARIKERTFNALIRRIERLSEDKPVVLLFEDAHWADPSSLELLEYGLDRLAKRPVLLVASSRPEFTPSWTDRPGVSRLALGRLGRRHSEALATQVIGRPDISPPLVDRIVRGADGVPLFIEELAKSLLDGPGPGEPDAALQVPPTLQASLMARLDRIPLARQVAQTGAIIGREFTRALLSALCRPGSPQLDDGLADLVEAGLAAPTNGSVEGAYVFKHALVQEVAYQSLLRTERRVLHGRLAAVLEAERPDIVSSRPEVLAQHWSEGGAVAKAVGYWAVAARLSFSRSAVAEAKSQITKGLRLLALLPETPDRWMPELQLTLSLAVTFILTRGFGAPEAGEACARAKGLWTRLGCPAAIAGPVFYGAWFVLYMRAEFGTASQVADELSSFSARTRSPALRSMALQQQAAIHLSLGGFRTALTLCQRALALDDPSHNASYGIFQSHRPSMALSTYLARTLGYLGYPAPAAAGLEAAAVASRKSDTAITVAWTLCQTFFGEWAFSTLPDLTRRAEEILALAETYELHQFLDAAYAGRGWCMIAAGRVEEGLSLLAQSSSFLGWGTNLYEPFRLLLLADGHLRACDAPRGLGYADKAMALIETTNERWIEPEILRVRGELLAASGDRHAARRSIQAATEVARSQNAKAWELRSTLSLARLLRDDGRLPEARLLLDAVVGWFGDGCDTPDMRDAVKFLAT